MRRGTYDGTSTTRSRLTTSFPNELNMGPLCRGSSRGRRARDRQAATTRRRALQCMAIQGERHAGTHGSARVSASVDPRSLESARVFRPSPDDRANPRTLGSRPLGAVVLERAAVVLHSGNPRRSGGIRAAGQLPGRGECDLGEAGPPCSSWQLLALGSQKIRGSIVTPPTTSAWPMKTSCFKPGRWIWSPTKWPASFRTAPDRCTKSRTNANR